MAKTTVVDLTKEPYDVYIGRGGMGKDGYFGNPFSRKPAQPRGFTLKKYKIWFDDKIQNDPEFAQRIHELRGKVLGCFCKPHPCHGDIIAEYLNNYYNEQKLGENDNK